MVSIFIELVHRNAKYGLKNKKRQLAGCLLKVSDITAQELMVQKSIVGSDIAHEKHLSGRG